MPELPSLRPPALAVPTLSPDGGAVAYVSRLVRRVLVDSCGEVPTVQLSRQGVPATAGRSDTFRFLRRVIRTQLTTRPDWWLYTHLGLARIALRVPSSSRRPYALFLHGREVWNHALTPDRLRALEGAALRIAGTTYAARRIERSHPGLGPIHVCPLALLPDEPRPGREAWGPSVPAGTTSPEPDAYLLERVQPRSVLVLNRVDPGERRRGARVLIEAWAEVRARVPDAQLVIVGQDGPNARLAQQLGGEEESVLFTGWLPDAELRALRRRVAVFAMPGAGGALVHLEAMRDGLPCIGNASDSAADVITNYETGFLVPRNDPEALADAIVPLLTDDDLRRTMGEAGRRRFEERHTFAHFQAQLLGLLASVFSDP